MKRRIGICEDVKAQQRNLCHMVEAWANESGYQAEVRLYDHASAFWFDWSGGLNLDILLLDIDLGEGQRNGMELAKIIREKDPRLVIIFITAMSEYMSQGYDVQAFHFLVKPVEEARLREVLNRAVWVAPAERKREYLLLSEEGQVMRVAFDEIVYAEAFSHSVTLHLSADARRKGVTEMEVRSLGMKELEKRLPAEDFFRCHRSYILNLSHVNRLEKCQVFMDDGNCLPVSRRREKELFRAFVDYYREDQNR